MPGPDTTTTMATLDAVIAHLRAARDSVDELPPGNDREALLGSVTAALYQARAAVQFLADEEPAS